MCQDPLRLSPYITGQFLFNLVCIKENVSNFFSNIKLDKLSISIQFNMCNRKCVDIFSEYHPI